MRLIGRGTELFSLSKRKVRPVLRSISDEEQQFYIELFFFLLHLEEDLKEKRMKHKIHLFL